MSKSMSTPRQYRAKAAEYEPEQSFTVLAENERWMTDSRGETLQAAERAEE